MPLATCETIVDPAGIETVVKKRSERPFRLGLGEASQYLGVTSEELVSYRGIPGIEIVTTGSIQTNYYNDTALANLARYLTDHPCPADVGTRQFIPDPLKHTATFVYTSPGLCRRMILQLQ